MSKKLNIQGGRYGRLLVTAYAGVVRSGTAWVCRCTCGKTVTVRANSLRTGNTQSCGCLMLENVATLHRTHGLSGTRTYRIFKAMWTRCTNKKQATAGRYVLRGISICARWKKYENFLADMGLAPLRASLDRYPDCNGNYEPGNCRWASFTQQARNTAGKRGTRSNRRGVSWVVHLRKWRAVVCVGSKRHHLGVFSVYEEAVAAREAGEKRFWKIR